MKARVEIRDKEKEKMLTGTIEVQSNGFLFANSLFDKDGNKFNFEVRSDHPDHLQCLLRKDLDNKEEPFISFEFPELETGKTRILFVGIKIPTGKFAKSPWVVAVTLCLL